MKLLNIYFNCVHFQQSRAMQSAHNQQYKSMTTFFIKQGIILKKQKTEKKT